MQIVSVNISNYRNLDGLEVTFDSSTNFLVGENELGKSNLLDLFDLLFNRQKFSDEDFAKTDIPIEIEFSLQLSEAEIGNFQDYFVPDKNNIISIKAIQKLSDLDEEIIFYWQRQASTPIEINKYHLKKINYIAYNSLKTPQDELTFYRGRGGGKFLNYLIHQFISSDSQIDVGDFATSTAKEIQSPLNRVKIFQQLNLSVSPVSENALEFLTRVLVITGRDGLDIQKSGLGTQFSIMLILSILERLMSLHQKQNFKPFEEKRTFFSKEEYEVFCEMYLNETSSELSQEEIIRINKILEPITREKDGKYHIDTGQLRENDEDILGEEIIKHIKTRKSISLILGLDEPEIHLHPYMQRHLIKYILELLNNQDSDFLFLLKKYFDVDALNGQMLLVSHSPTVILDKYEQIVRFYKKGGTKAVSGSQLNLDYRDKKHLLMNFPYIKEAFFSKCAVVSEGQSEAGALPLWANKIIGDIDEHGIVFINAGGDGSVHPIVKLLNHFQIPNVSILDNDNKNRDISIEGSRQTKYRDFEEELFEAVYKQDAKATELFDFLKQYGTHGLERYVVASNMNVTADEYKFSKTWNTTTANEKFFFKDVETENNKNLLKAMFLSWLTKARHGKTITSGRTLGKVISRNSIPTVYKQLFKDAKNKAES